MAAAMSARARSRPRRDLGQNHGRCASPARRCLSGSRDVPNAPIDLRAPLVAAAAPCAASTAPGADRGPLRPASTPRAAAVRPVGGELPLAARQRQHVAQLPRLSRQRGPRRRPARGVPARVLPARRHRRGRRATAAMPSGRARRASACRARSARTVLGRNAVAALPDDDQLQPVRRVVRLLAEHAPVLRQPRRVLGDTRWNNSVCVHQQPARPAARQLRRQRPRGRRPARSTTATTTAPASPTSPGPFAAALAWRDGSRTAPCRCPPASTARR